MAPASSTLLVLLAVSAAAQTTPPVGRSTAGQDTPGLSAKQIANHTGGVVTYYSSNRLKDDQSQVATNVFFDKDSGVVKRSGQVLYGSISGCSSQVRSGAEYDSPNGVAYFFEACGNHVYESLGSGSWTVLGGTINATSNVFFVQGMGYEWITDGIDPLWSTDGVNISSYTYPGSITATGQAPLAQLISVFQDRLVLGNVSGGKSAVYLAGYNSGSNGTPLDFTLPSVLVDTSAAIFGLNGLNDGLQVTCMSSAFRGVLILWDHNSMYGLYGSGYSSFILREIAEIGCDEQSSVQEFDGKLIWLSKYGLYQYDGANHPRISDEIKDQIQNIITTESGYLSYVQDEQGQWQAGNLTVSGPGAPMSATVDPGDVVPSTWAVVDTGALWAGSTFVNVSSNSGNISLIQGTNASFPNINGEFGISTNYVVAQWAPIATIGVVLPNIRGWGLPPNQTFDPVSSCLTASPITVTVFDPVTGLPVLSTTAYFSALSQTEFHPYSINTSSITQAMIQLQIEDISPSYGSTPPQNMSVPFVRGTSISGAIYYAQIPNGPSANLCYVYAAFYSSASLTGYSRSQLYDTTFSTPTFGEFEAAISSFSISTDSLVFQTRVSATSNGALSSPSVATIGGQLGSDQKEFILYESSFSVDVTTEPPPTIYSAILDASTTGYFITQCFNTSPIVSWGAFESDNDPGNGAISYWLNSGATCGAVQSPTASWTPQTNFTSISVATNTYLGVRVLFNGFPYFDPLNQPTLQDVTINWKSVAGRPNMATQIFDNRFWMAYTTSTSGTAFNNSVLIYDSEGHWSGPFVGVNAASLTTYQRVLYSGSSLGDGNVIIQNQGTSDLGNAILYDFRTPDYELDAFNTVDLYDLNLEFLAVPSGYSPNLQVQYYVDQGTTPYSLGNTPLTVGTRGLIYSNARFPLNGSPLKAHTVSFELIDDTPTPLTFYRSMIRFTPEDGP